MLLSREDLIWGIAVEERAFGMRRLTAGALTLTLVVTLLVILVSPSPSASAATGISVSPTAGRPGTSATVTGTEFLPIVGVAVCWDGEFCSSASPGLTGGFSVTTTVPDVTAGLHTISACQAGLPCSQATFEVLSAPETSTTIPDTTTTSAPTTTTTQPTTTSTAPATTTTPPGPTTTRPGPTTTTTTPTTTTTTTAPPPTVTTTTLPGQVGSSSSTSTTDGVVFPTETTVPLPEASAAPFSLDVKTLVAQLFAPDPEAPVDAEAAPEGAVGVGSPLAPVAAPEGEEEVEEGSEFALGDLSPASSGFQPRFGIWLIWLVVVLGSAGLALTLDEKRRRKDRG